MNQIAKGPTKCSNIISELNIDGFADAVKKTVKDKPENLQIYIITLDMGCDSSHYSQTDLWDLAYNIFLKFLSCVYKNTLLFPFMILCVNRKTYSRTIKI